MLRRVSASAFSCKSKFDLTLRAMANLDGQKKAMSTATLDVAGVYPPVPTPFDSNEDIDYVKLEENFQRWDKIPFRGYVVQGSNGEYAYMTREERVALVAWVKERTPREKLVIAGSGCESTRDTVEMSQKMAAAGADALLVVTPCFYKGGMTNSALTAHYTKVANESPVPIILYSVPANTGLDLDPEVAIGLSEHPNIIGMKDSGGDISKIAYIVYKTQANGFQVLAGSASFLYPALAVGCVGGVCALANVLGEACCELQQLATDGRLEQAKQLQHRLIAPNGAVTKRFGIAGLKQAMEWFGFNGGPTRAPLQPLTPENTAILRQIFESNKFL